MLNFSWHDNCLSVYPALPYAHTYEFFRSLPRVLGVEYFGQSMLVQTDCELEIDKDKFLRAFQQSYVLALGILEGML